MGEDPAEHPDATTMRPAMKRTRSISSAPWWSPRSVGLEGHPVLVTDLPGAGHQVGDLDRGELAEALGLATDLHGDRVTAPVADGEEVHVVERHPVHVDLLDRLS